jgi:deazaflavin-dependent oxidoreductase (nitroreductase family)
MNSETHNDPAEQIGFLRLFYRDWRPTRAGRVANRLAAWSSALGLSSKAAVLEVRGRVSGRPRSIPVVIASLDGARYLVSMLGPASDWVKNVEAADGSAVLRQRGRHAVRLVAVPPTDRAPILREYVRVATSGRNHLPVPVGAPLPEFEAIAERYPVYRIDPAQPAVGDRLGPARDQE